MAWYETEDNNGPWDTRTNTLTFHTFRPRSPDDLTAVSGVTPQMFNGTLERRKINLQNSARLKPYGEHSDFGYATPSVYGSLQNRPQSQPRMPPPDYYHYHYYKPMQNQVKMESENRVRAQNQPHVPVQNGCAPLQFARTNGLSTDGNVRLAESYVLQCPPPKVLRNYQELLVDIRLAPADNLAGFSMAGGCEADGAFVATRVYRIMKGSAAERAGLEVNDEIVEINGIPVVKSTHAEVIRLIHESIQSKTIQLKVHRKFDISSNDAVVNNSSCSSTSPSSLTDSDNNNTNGAQTSNFNENDIHIKRSDEPEFSSKFDFQETEESAERRRPKSDDDKWRKSYISDAYFVTDNAHIKTQLLHEISQRFPGARAVDIMQPAHQTPGAILAPNSNSDPDSASQRPQNGGHNVHSNGHYQQYHSHNHVHHHPSQNDPIDDNGALTQIPSRHEEQETSFIVGETNGDIATTVLVRTPMNNGPPTGAPISIGQYYGGSKTSLSRDDPEERLKRYEMDLQKRRLSEERQAKEQEFLRSSVRGSKKLQALEKHARATNGAGHANDAYIDGEHEQNGDASTSPVRSRSPTPAENGPVALEDILMSVNRVTGLLDQSPRHKNDSEFLRNLFTDQTVRNAIDVTAAAQQHWGSRKCKAVPEAINALELTDELIRQLALNSSSDVAAELLAVVNNPFFQSALQSHDQTAEIFLDTETRNNGQTVNDAAWRWGVKETCLDESNVDLRIVKLMKNGDNPLGATVMQEGKGIVIGRVIKGGVAEKSGLLREGDELLEVNGIDLRTKSVHEVCNLLSNMHGELSFIVAPNLEAKKTEEAVAVVKHMRALYDYDPENDIYLPCRELGLAFNKGDILHVISMSDSNWWQAHRDGEENYQLAGLIPSTSLQLQKNQYVAEVEGDSRRGKGRRTISAERRASIGGGFWCAKRRKNKKPTATTVFGNGSRKRWSTPGDLRVDGPKTDDNDDDPYTETNDEQELLTYEEVALYLSRTGSRRPVVLVGPTHVGCLQLRQKLMETEKEKFAGVVPHTSRPRKPDEQDGVHYHFVTRQHFQEGVTARKFVEWGEYQKHHYGTSYEAIRRVVERGKTCVLTLKAQSLKALRNSDLMPFVVFVAPPSLERLKANKRRNETDPSLKDDDLRNIIAEAKQIEEDFGHLFDKTIINYDLERSFQELRTAIHRLETEPQWVPISWIRRQQRVNGSNHTANHYGSNR